LVFQFRFLRSPVIADAHILIRKKVIKS
jgi:hypothetical protein